MALFLKETMYFRGGAYTPPPPGLEGRGRFAKRSKGENNEEREREGEGVGIVERR